MISFQNCGLTYPPNGIMDVAAKSAGMPVFEVLSGGKHYKIYADGRIEGFDGSPLVIVNRIPALIKERIS